jgi:serine/threonine protein kinase
MAGNYDLLEKVGQGAQGSVYRAVHRPTGETVAIKRIDIATLSEKEKKAALNEVRVLTQLRDDPHPYVMMFKEAFVDDENLNIVLQWCPKGTLQDKMGSLRKQGRWFTEDEVWGALLSLASGLYHLHARKILHRDLKPANIFVLTSRSNSAAAAGGPGKLEVQLGDFGVSCVLEDRSKAETVVGTPYYLSPELCKGERYSSKSDIWSLGVVLYVMCNDKMPFNASNYAALILRIVQQQAEKQNTTFSPSLHRMATWCMQKDSKQRPTAAEILVHPDCVAAAVRLGIHLPEELESVIEEIVLNTKGSNARSRLIQSSIVKQQAPQRGGLAPQENAGSMRGTVPQLSPALGRVGPAIVTPGLPLPIRRDNVAIGGLAPKKTRNNRVVASPVQTGPPPAVGSGYRPPSSGGWGVRPVSKQVDRGSGKPAPKVDSCNPDPDSYGLRRPPRPQRTSKQDVNAVRNLPTFGQDRDASDDEDDNDEDIFEDYREESDLRATDDVRPTGPAPPAATSNAEEDYIDDLQDGNVDRPESIEEIRHKVVANLDRPSSQNYDTYRAFLRASHEGRLAARDGVVEEEIGGTLRDESDAGNSPKQTTPGAAVEIFDPSAMLDDEGGLVVDEESPVSISWKVDGECGTSVATVVVPHPSVSSPIKPTPTFSGPSLAQNSKRPGGLQPSTKRSEQNRLSWQSGKPTSMQFAQHADITIMSDYPQEESPSGNDARPTTQKEFTSPPERLNSTVTTNCSTARESSEGSSPPMVLDEVFEETVVDDTSRLRNLSDLNQQAIDLLQEGQRIVGDGVMGEVVAAITQDRPMSGQALQEFIAAKVPLNHTAEVLYLAFRYAFVEGEKRRLMHAL